MTHAALIVSLIGAVSLLYATAGQAGGTAFVAVMAFASFPASEMRPTALFLNVVAAGYATAQLLRKGAIDIKTLAFLSVPSIVTAFIGGLLVLDAREYFTLTGVLLVTAGLLMVLKRNAESVEPRAVRSLPAALAGAASGLLSGLTGVGGGVFLAPMLVALGWASAKRAAALSPPFILCNSAVGLLGVLLAGQRLGPAAPLYAVGALAGAILGSTIALRWMSERATQYVLAAILLFAGLRLLLR
ncbi:sulfite exporter TauE/SafE family protein [Methylocystis heyeri]|uniref:Probable membrane transporter protein n=1 Tax=Methylocystis heyeri TaxID=391905 RepID=A0A6B8KF46_9HYPH|nr:sulfite exporter TauE/SafE family protein [Methylocystis heyeri]QGM45010.1 TSUP family transporter [Methylocystis heyeri]